MDKLMGVFTERVFGLLVEKLYIKDFLLLRKQEVRHPPVFGWKAVPLSSLNSCPPDGNGGGVENF